MTSKEIRRKERIAKLRVASDQDIQVLFDLMEYMELRLKSVEEAEKEEPSW